MKYRSAKGFSGWAQLGILIGFAGVGLIFAGIIQFIIGKSLIAAGTPFADMANQMMKALLDPKNVLYLQLSQVAGTLFLMFIPTIAYSLLCNGKDMLWLGFSRRINIMEVILGLAIIYCANIVANPAADLTHTIVSHFPRLDKWAQSLEAGYTEQVMALSNLKSNGELIVALIIMAFLPALFEEMFFRGAVQNLFVRWWRRPLAAIVFTALLFSFIHGSVYLFLSRAILGFALGLMYYQSKNLWVNITAHFLNNAIAVVQLFIITRSGHKADLVKPEDRMPLWIELLFIIVFCALFIWFKKIAAAKRSKIETDEQKLWIKATPQFNLAQNQQP